MNDHIPSYPSIYALGHRAIANIFDSEVTIEEKVDGSQFSFGIIDGEFRCRSKGQQIVPSAPEKLFTLAVESVRNMPLNPGWIYRGEYLRTPAHNTLSYSRTPYMHVILFDVQTDTETYLNYQQKLAEAARLGLDVVPLVHQGRVDSLDTFKGFLDRESILGGCKIEGVVIKNYNVFTHEKKIAIGKYVSENFKEIHGVKWRASNPTKSDIVQMLVTALKTEARWNKAIQHLRDAGQITDSPQDIGKLITEIPNDILGDSKDKIIETLFDHFWPQIRRGVVAGFPEFYKDKLAAKAFTPKPGDQQQVSAA